jgi:predicted acetyltransferase
MPALIDPDTRLRESFLAAVAEFRADATHPVPWFITDIDPVALTDLAAFSAYVEHVLRERDEAAPRPAHFVPMTTLWWADGAEVLGRLAIRHRLTPPLEHSGGHIGYDVRPGARVQGSRDRDAGSGAPDSPVAWHCRGTPDLPGRQHWL